mmetsp:Transcript_94719/g.267405  ORF Transcript_94719/g.267405 Transcript_94719/m.267405 type:complete len:202 (-) Transcript_94719:335-940(-)
MRSERAPLVIHFAVQRGARPPAGNPSDAADAPELQPHVRLGATGWFGSTLVTTTRRRIMHPSRDTSHLALSLKAICVLPPIDRRPGELFPLAPRVPAERPARSHEPHAPSGTKPAGSAQPPAGCCSRSPRAAQIPGFRCDVAGLRVVLRVTHAHSGASPTWLALLPTWPNPQGCLRWPPSALASRRAANRVFRTRAADSTA